MYQENINTSIYSPQSSQIDTTFNNFNPGQDAQIINDTSQVSMPTPRSTEPFYMNEVNQAMNQSHLSQSTQAYNSNISNFSFYYCFNLHPHHIKCEEVQVSFDTFSQMINNTDNISTYKIYVFYHEQTVTKKIYKVTCEIISHTFMIQLLNQNIYGIEFNQTEQQQEVPRQHFENLKLHLRNDLAHYFSSKQIYKDNQYDDLYNTINSNVNILNHFQQSNANTLPYNQSSTLQRDDNRHGDGNYTQNYYNHVSQP
ncbi:18513_t:CDS:1 [Funneliformis geosporum]|uniref:14459_t:CDS:1 n=1 Tax=Funneliformis geosporum TaxID=1117311 RepID=A0A9W4WYW9_9GLOM|nr:18513_t:CDS:1 [Funneliformis geosporum]CAI2189551.1 14459_t:CDS:1 [Funneliformis geosporum]